MRKKLGLLCLALVLAFGTLGVGYALWYEDLYIEGTVNTGILDVEWSVEGYGSDETKLVSSIDAYSYGDAYLYIDIWNAYPCVTYWVDFDITNIGTIPVHVGEFVVLYNDLPGAAFTFDWDGPDQIHPGDHGYGRIEIHFDNTAWQDWYYWFYIGVTCGQYNEFPVGGPFQGF